MEDISIDGEFYIGQMEDNGADESRFLFARLLRWLVAIVFISYAVASSVMDIKIGFYGIKLVMLGSACLLLLKPANYSFLLGLIVPMYYMFKPGMHASVETSYMINFVFLITMFMAVVNFALHRFGHKRNPYQRFDLASFCLFAIVGLSFLGSVAVVNRFLYVHRVLKIISFGCGYYLGKSYLRNVDDFKMLLKGLCLGIFAFLWPLTVGYVMQHGFYILPQLYMIRTELGSSPPKESGCLLVAFGLAVSVSGSAFPFLTKQFALWLVAVPSGLIILLMQSRAAIFSLPVAVVLTLFLSGRRRSALVVLILLGVVGFLVYSYGGGVFISLEERMVGLSAAAEARMEIYRTGIQAGLAHPLFGLGAGQMRARMFAWHSHNDEINMLAEHGLLAFVIYILLWFYLLYIAFRLYMTHDVFLRPLAGVFLVVMACYFIYSQFEPLYFNRGGILFTALMGSMTALYSKYQAEKQFLSYV